MVTMDILPEFKPDVHPENELPKLSGRDMLILVHTAVLLEWSIVLAPSQ